MVYYISADQTILLQPTVLISAKKRIRFQFIIYIFLLLLVFEFKFVVTTIFYHIFPLLRQHPFTMYMYIEAIQCKLSLYLKKAEFFVPLEIYGSLPENV